MVKQTTQKEVRSLHPLRKRLEHVRFRYKAECVIQRSISRGKARGIVKIHQSALRCAAHGVHVGRHGFVFLFHSSEQCGLHDASEVLTCCTTQFVVLCCDQGHGIGIVSSVAYMSIHEHMRPELGEYPAEGARIFTVALDKVPIEVQIAGIAPESISLRTILVGACGGVATQGTIHIVYRNDAQDD